MPWWWPWRVEQQPRLSTELGPGPRGYFLPAGCWQAMPWSCPFPRPGNQALERSGVLPKGLGQDEPDLMLADLLPLVRGPWEAAARRDGTGLSRPARHRGTTGLNLSRGDDPYAESDGQPRARQLKDARFHSRSIIPRLPEALGPDEQTPVLFPRTDSSGSFHLGSGLGWLGEATWHHLTGSIAGRAQGQPCHHPCGRMGVSPIPHPMAPSVSSTAAGGAPLGPGVHMD